MKSLPYIMFIVFVGAAFGDEAARVHNLNRLDELRSIAVDQVAGVKVAKIQTAEGSKQSRGEFHGYIATSKWRELRVDDADLLLRTLTEVIDGWIDVYKKAGDEDVVELSSFCVPKPGYGIHLQTKGGSRDFAVCLECGEMYVFGKRKTAVVVHLREEQTARLKRCYLDELR